MGTIPLGRGLAGAATLILACGLAAVGVRAQQTLSPAEVHQVTCFTMQFPEVRSAFARGTGPLLVVSGREVGRLQRPRTRCPSRPELPPAVSELRYLRPHSAPVHYGERGRNGAVLVDLRPAGPR